jgi:hypothetical protein
MKTKMVAINGEKLAERDWRDTVVVPRKGSVTFRSRFLDFTGRFVHHNFKYPDHIVAWPGKKPRSARQKPARPPA